MSKKLLILVSLLTFLASFASAQAESTWPEGEFESKFQSVFDSEMHYVEHGEGDPILLVHGIPTWSYLWRNMIEPLSEHGRVIAIDMIGYGKSGRPNIKYTLADLQDYLAEFIVKQDLHNIRLVVHDFGGPVALPVAAKLKDRISGIVAFETLLAPIAKPSSLDDFQLMLNDRARGDVIGFGGQGFDQIVRNAIFINILPQFMPPTTDFDEYKAHFENPLHLWSIYRPFQDIPIAKKPRKDYKRSKRAVKFMRNSDIPKLYIYPTPGFATGILEGSPETAKTFKNIDIVPFGPGAHFLQEENPEKLNTIIKQWLKENFPIH